MIFELIGYALSSLLVAILVAFKISSDIYPKAFKAKLIRLALSNWRNKLVTQFSTYKPLSPKCIDDTGLFATKGDCDAEKPKEITNIQDSDQLLFYGLDDDGNCLLLKMKRGVHNYAHVDIYMKIDGNEYTTTIEGNCANETEFSIGTFKLEMNEAMRSWRLWYNGMVQNKSDNGNMVHGVINVLWKAIDVPWDNMKDANLNLLTEYVTGKGAFGESFTQLPKILPKGYYQCGAYNGIVKLDNVECTPLYLYGFRVRNILRQTVSSSTKAQSDSDQHLELFGMCESDGKLFRLTGMKDGWTGGCTMDPSLATRPIVLVEGHAEQFFQNNTLPKFFSFNNDKASYRIEIWPAVEHTNFRNFDVILLKLTINGEKGRGILLRKSNSLVPLCKENNTEESFYMKMHPSKLLSSLINSDNDIVALDSEKCLISSLVGGKGSSLAQLATLGKSSSEFKTAKGFCVTTELFKKSLDINKISALFNEHERKLEDICSDVIDLIKSNDAETKISVLVNTWMENIFGSHQTDIRFAVRSSGIFEDASDLSCAGQNDTFLGVGARDVPLKIVQCWASLFTLQSVRYRLNHGKPSVTAMGVVVQEMVDAKAAGVLFTADPLTGNPFEMIITANFGLGESVVSATSDPDTFQVLRSRNPTSAESTVNYELNLAIGTKKLGKKNTMILLNSQGEATKEVTVTEQDSSIYCLADETVLKLGSIALKIEKKFGQLKPIDVEWAVDQKGEIFILQSRPVTSLDAWTDFELRHEFDTAVRTKFERHTTANTGEVLPHALTTLATGVTARLLDFGIQRRFYKRSGDLPNPYAMERMGIFEQRTMLNMIPLIYRAVDKDITPALVCVDINLFGHRVIDEEIHDIALKRFGPEPGKSKLKNFIGAIMSMVRSKNILKTANEKFGGYRFQYKNCFEDMAGLYNRISDEMFQLYECMDLHSDTSETSSITQIFAFLFLSENRSVDDWDHKLYEDQAVLLSVCADVESADMPTAMEELADKIVNHGVNIEEFIDKNTDPQKALQWIKQHDVINTALEKFFSKHGHRCIAELDVGTQSWQTNPAPLIGLLKNIVRNKCNHKGDWSAAPSKTQFANDDDLLKSLKTPISNTTKRLLKLLLPSSRNSVLNRERSKSLLVWTTDQLKRAYARLAELMEREKILPDTSLLVFLSHPEIGQLIRKESCSPKILYKAMRRQKIHNSMSKKQYPEVNVGYPKPIDDTIHVEITDSIQATPVSSGKVQGTAKVCRSVEEASEILQPGDILITHGTDIAWSPFFPLLGGVVTELGGLISHGAVVAREYGLPCVVAAANATKIFKSGEQVLLDAETGIISKVKVNT